MAARGVLNEIIVQGCSNTAALSESTVLTIQAHVTNVEQNITTLWAKIALDHPEVKTVDTKLAELIQKAAALNPIEALRYE